MFTFVLFVLSLAFELSVANDVSGDERKINEAECLYTINVHGSRSDLCRNDVSANGLASLHRDLKNQYLVIDEKLDAVLNKFSANKTLPVAAEPASRSSGGGVTYVTWGRTSCPNTATLIYEGKRHARLIEAAVGVSSSIMLQCLDSVDVITRATSSLQAVKAHACYLCG